MVPTLWKNKLILLRCHVYLAPATLQPRAFLDKTKPHDWPASHYILSTFCYTAVEWLFVVGYWGWSCHLSLVTFCPSPPLVAWNPEWPDSPHGQQVHFRCVVVRQAVADKDNSLDCDWSVPHRTNSRNGCPVYKMHFPLNDSQLTVIFSFFMCRVEKGLISQVLRATVSSTIM